MLGEEGGEEEERRGGERREEWDADGVAGLGFNSFISGFRKLQKCFQFIKHDIINYFNTNNINIFSRWNVVLLIAYFCTNFIHFRIRALSIFPSPFLY